MMARRINSAQPVPVLILQFESPVHVAQPGEAACSIIMPGYLLQS